MNKKISRGAGILLAVSSLPSDYGIGSFGRAAFDFVDFLALAGQKYWQILPIGPTGYGDSPYQSFSAFAGNPYFIDLKLLQEEGLLTEEECAEAFVTGRRASHVDYLALFENREPIFRKAFSRFKDHGALKTFRLENKAWLEDYALFMAVKKKMGHKSWQEWDDDIRLRREKAVKAYGKALKSDIDYHVFAQYMFFKQWGALKRYANEKGVKIIGDIPIYASMDSADVWANSGLFLLDDDKNPIDVAGVPPDYFSKTGQLWGNPLYRWDVLKETGYGWWLKRLESCFKLYDIIRIDHFRGFEGYYAIPHGSKTAVSGEWRKGPGIDFIGVLNKTFGRGCFIAEDLGVITRGVKRLLRESGYPGMKVLQFAFDSGEENDYRPHNYTANSVVYTGTHDNDTTRGWILSAKKKDLAQAMRYMGCRDENGMAWAFIRLAMASVSKIAVVPIQDYLNLDGRARMNVPSTIGGNNWRFRIRKNTISPALTRKIRKITKLYGR
ncbi:MAG: 4-alpha-glucanotransferase [Oscillospiraceae bacterium]|nr:4-alpha-glucanotransferase [Oscillospiraceae bacterium]